MSLGSDFECFMFNKDSGAFMPEIMLGLPDKGEPQVPLTLSGNPVGFIHRDNVSVEMCTPAVACADFAESVRKTLDAAKAYVMQRAQAILSPVTTVELPDELLAHPHAIELGCDIDQIADTSQMDSVDRQALRADMLGNKRHGGGHVHISYPYHEVPRWVAALLCDLFIGFPMQHKLDVERAQWYGVTGLHRQTTYPNGTGGVEYRALDSGWVHTHEDRMLVQRGATAVHDILHALDHDLIAQLMRIRSAVPASVLIVDIDPEQAAEMAAEARELAGG